MKVLINWLNMMRCQLKNKFLKAVILTALFFSSFIPFSFAVDFIKGETRLIKSIDENFILEKIIDGLGTPWAMAFVDTDKLLVSEREGAIFLLNLKAKTAISLKGLPDILSEGQGGMLDIALPPDYQFQSKKSEQTWIYFTYVKSKNGLAVTVLARAQLNQDGFVDWQELLVTSSGTSYAKHFGSRIAFDNNGYVYFGVGDRGERANAQNNSNHAGTIMRLYRNGQIPEDNPFYQKKTFLPEIWSYGHRNPQGLAFDNKNNRLWEIEHGPRGGDEINLIQKGKNYGWPIVSHGKEYWAPLAVGEGTHKKGMATAVKVYTPSIAPGSLLFFKGEAFKSWQGNLFSGALKLRHLNRVVLNTKGQVIKEERLLKELDERIRSLTEDKQGRLYFSTDSGSIYRISPIN